MPEFKFNSEDIAVRVIKYDHNWVIDNTDIAEGDIVRCTRRETLESVSLCT